jgi:hypothetical protein
MLSVKKKRLVGALVALVMFATIPAAIAVAWPRWIVRQAVEDLVHRGHKFTHPSWSEECAECRAREGASSQLMEVSRGRPELLVPYLRDRRNTTYSQRVSFCVARILISTDHGPSLGRDASFQYDLQEGTMSDGDERWVHFVEEWEALIGER